MQARLSKVAAVAALLAAGAANAVPVSGQGTWETTLQARDVDGDGTTDAFYDTQLDITWLANANANGLMNWSDANAWAGNLVLGNVDDWRLPTTTDVGNDGCNYQRGGGGLDCGFIPNASSSELATLYYVTLGNLGAPSDDGSPDDGLWGLANTGSFVDMRQNVYWSATAYQPDPTTAWGFSNYFGYQGPYDTGYLARAIAVHDGDVAVPPVPEPSTYALLLAGLGVIGFLRRKAR